MNTMVYCPECGGYHEVTTAGCPFKYQSPIMKTQMPPSVIEQKLDKIIDLLKAIEYHLRTK
jgi:hypothetical protein